MNTWPEASPELLARATQSEEGFMELYTMYAERVLRFLLVKTGHKPLAEDLAQETFISVMRSLPKYRDHGKPFSHWLLTIANNHVRMHFRKKRPEPIGDEQLVSVFNEAVGSYSVEDNAQIRIDVLAGMRMLSENDQQLLHLKYIEDLPNTEIARICGISANACTVRIHRALGRLSKQLHSYEE